MLSISANRIETTSKITPSSQSYIFFEKNRGKLCEMIKTLDTDTIERLKSIEWFKNNFKDDFNELSDLCDQAVEVVKMNRNAEIPWSHDYTTSLKRNVSTNPYELWAMYGQSSHPTLAKLRIKIANFMIPISNSGKVILILIIQDFLNKFLPIIDSNDINNITISNLRSVLYNILNKEEYRDIIMENGELIEIEAGFWNSDSFKRVCLNNTTHRTFKEFVECPCNHYVHDNIMQSSSLNSIEEIILIRRLTGSTQVYPSEKHFSVQYPRTISVGRSRENDLCFLYGKCVHRKHGNFIVENSRVIYKDNIRSDMYISWIKHTDSDSCSDQETSEKRLCLICMTNPRTVVFQPCFHYTMCRECFDSMKGHFDKCVVCKQDYTCISYTVGGGNQDECTHECTGECSECGECSDNDDMKTMVSDKYKEKLCGRRKSNLSNDFATIMRNMGFHPTSNGGEVVKKGTQIAFLGNNLFFIKVNIDKVVEQIMDECRDDEIQPEIIFQFVKKYNVKITLEDVTRIWSNWDYDLGNTIRVILHEIKEQVFDIFVINIDTLTI